MDGAPGPDVSILQMLSSAKLRIYARRDGFPGWGADTAGMMPSSPTNGRRSGVLPAAMLILNSEPFAAKTISLFDIHLGP